MTVSRCRTTLAYTATLAIALSACSGSNAANDGSSGNADTATDATTGAPVSGVFGGTPVQFQQAEAVYSHTTDETTITAQYTGATTADDRAFTLFFPGNATGTFTCGSDASNVTTGFTFDTSNAMYASTSSASLTPCQIVVSAYGAVGSEIVGTFSGSVFANSTLGGAPQQIQISSGTYRVSRLPDQ
jgi:hypothetical protein